MNTASFDKLTSQQQAQQISQNLHQAMYSLYLIGIDLLTLLVIIGIPIICIVLLVRSSRKKKKAEQCKAPMQPNVETQKQNLTNTTPEKLKVMATFKDAWKITRGAKWPMWVMLLIAGIIETGLLFSLPHGFLHSLISHANITNGVGSISELAVYLATLALLVLFTTSCILIAVQRCRNQIVSYRSGLQFLKRWPAILWGFIVMYILVPLAFLIPLVIIGAILLSVIFSSPPSTTIMALGKMIFDLFYLIFAMLALPLIVDKKMKPLVALHGHTKK